jgi:hypothetical protein
MFEYQGELFRAVNRSYQPDYDHFLASGLCRELINQGLMVPFEEMEPTQFGLPDLYKILKPERIQFISYPYEWAFNMLKDAALLTLKIQKLALEHGMSLKDASAYNVQFQKGKPVFIDTLSFELYPIDHAWTAYRQFCQHFLAPLALMTYIDPGLNRMFIIYLDGIPLDLAVKMLPLRSRFSLGLYLNIFLHSKSQKKYNSIRKRVVDGKQKFSLRSMRSLVDGLESTVHSLRWKARGTEWADYTNENVHSVEYIQFKNNVISGWLDAVKPEIIWDLGANTGDYSRLAAQKGIDIISFDMDPSCVNKNYEMVKNNRETNIHPLLLDILNPSPSIGWEGIERISFYNRNRPDLVMALAIIHHLAISANIPLDLIAKHLAGLASHLIIEFVPKEDDKVKLLLLNREDIFPDYTQIYFEKAMLKYFNIEQKIPADCNLRIFYLMTIR